MVLAKISSWFVVMFFESYMNSAENGAGTGGSGGFGGFGVGEGL